jgi:ketosteroid isomerase-like protein
MDDDALRAANDSFYMALENLDLASMDALWLHEDWVRCVHPGWEVLVGWTAVRKSWQQIFANTRWIRVTPTTVEIKRFGDVGVVGCLENISTKDGDEVGLAVAQATNLYLRAAHGWRLFHHHASPAPVHVTQPFSGTVQ